MLKHTHRKRAKTLATAALLALIGWQSAVFAEAGASTDIKVEGVNSETARITRLILMPRKDQQVLRGEITRRIHAHGQIPGHLHLELISPQGKVVKTADINYSRPSSSSHVGSFELALPADIEAGSTVRVTHHDLSTHSQGSAASQWQDVTNGQ